MEFYGSHCKLLLVEAYSTARAKRKIKRHSAAAPVAMDITMPDMKQQDQSTIHNVAGKGVNDYPEGSSKSNDNGIEDNAKYSKKGSKSKSGNKKLGLVPSTWDPYSTGINSDLLKTSLASPETITPSREDVDEPMELKPEEPALGFHTARSASNDADGRVKKASEAKTLADAVKPKGRRKKKTGSGNTGN